jgi:hypothetical protein
MFSKNVCVPGKAEVEMKSRVFNMVLVREMQQLSQNLKRAVF